MKTVFLIGWPAGTSFSPAMFSAGFEAVGIDYSYIPLDVQPGRFREAAGVFVAANVAGANVTIPHKEDAGRLADVLTGRAQAAGAVNLLYKDHSDETYIDEMGDVGSSRQSETDSRPRIVGDNTDGQAVLDALAARGVEIEGLRVALFGAGGAARGCAAALASSGAGRIVILNRTYERAQELASRLDQIAGRPIACAVEWSPDQWAAQAATDDDGISASDRDCLAARLMDALSGADLVLNTTTVTRGGQASSGRPVIPDELEADAAQVISEQAVFCDLVYRPLFTAHLEQAERLGRRHIDGLEILLRQALPAFQVWTGLPAPAEAMARGLAWAAGVEWRDGMWGSLDLSQLGNPMAKPL